MMKSIYIFMVLMLSSLSSSADQLYRITLLRAAPGNFPELIQQVKTYKQSRKGELSIMRHSQGDHWDLMMLEPAGEQPLSAADFRLLADFQQIFLASSETSWSEIKPLANASGTFHIEMFKAVHGKVDELLEERKMENQYLTATQQTANIIFETRFGSDVDSFTIGYHQNLEAFAATPDLPSETFEQAAKDAGFKNRGDLSFYLRSLILTHHDTLATRVD